MLKMKPDCERCGEQLPWTAAAFICSYECTFCPKCTAEMENICPNCSGQLVARPTRDRKPTEVAATQVRSRLARFFGRS